MRNILVIGVSLVLLTAGTALAGKPEKPPRVDTETQARIDGDAALQNQIDNIQLIEGPAGVDGINGLSCWDLNGDDIADASEDINGDGYLNALDCQGSGVSIQGTLTLAVNSYEPYTCDVDHIGDVALTSVFTTCVCDEFDWVLTSNGTTDCDWGAPTVVSTVVSTTGRVWMDRNLGASRVATSQSDSLAYGDLYQWGRYADGHQFRNSATTTNTSSTDDPGHGNFIIVTTSPLDWRVPQNHSLWQGVSGINNPCPAGFRLPTGQELEDERASWSIQNSDGAFASPLKLVKAGFRSNSNGVVSAEGSGGFYWSSTNALDVYFDNGTAGLYMDPRAYGLSVRCIQD